MTKELIIPTFTESFFKFDDASLVPQHHDADPVAPNYPDLWSIYMSTGQRALTAAVDVIDAEQAELLAMAKRDYLEHTIQAYGYTTDVFILDPHGNSTRFYMGRSLSDS